MVTIYHNPRCSKSRACLQLLQEKGASVEIIDYLRQPLSLECVHNFAKRLGINAIVRHNEAVYKELQLTDADDETLLEAIIKHPQLLQRPIVVSGEQMLIARPPERVLELINDR
ncbi:arsenate reductase (glutaredoxin) [Legionella micdadei]|uniref:Arsenate reductase n=1 Tax=Legionella micdadei TaxID=451 RepID=A0A098GE35_LEGMI|nr:arsenate reductase (glutaredoxin) [Legionella micdadei]ARG96517.1 arsenate reductase (glutaredoxin) [Legionella micdadei]ARG99268.1 arsenate reductase (glutaredoxin) [Legionella micdadei]KTD27841.1 oxidoreductase [Legionella micdadei]NSL19557.1 arsenate reductase (glutaredoxin) [Legionella micdadei]CEG59746.1 Arsenate reductase (glutaredoxin) [Legionella micdadei]